MSNTTKAVASCVLPPIAVVTFVLTSYWSGGMATQQLQGTMLALATVYMIGASWGYLGGKFRTGRRRKTKRPNNELGDGRNN